MVGEGGGGGGGGGGLSRMSILQVVKTSSLFCYWGVLYCI